MALRFIIRADSKKDVVENVLRATAFSVYSVRALSGKKKKRPQRECDNGFQQQRPFETCYNSVYLTISSVPTNDNDTVCRGLFLTL